MKALEKASMIRRISILFVFSLCTVSVAGQEKSSFTKLSPSITKVTFNPIIPKGDTLPSSLMIRKFDYQKVYNNSLGFFCKTENKASKKAGLQMRLRLGTLEYVDRIEGKIK